MATLLLFTILLKILVLHSYIFLLVYSLWSLIQHGSQLNTHTTAKQNKCPFQLFFKEVFTKDNNIRTLTKSRHQSPERIPNIDLILRSKL